jgi:hypothetical protein
MSSKIVWRNLAFLLVLANLLFWMWSQGYLSVVGMGPKTVQEPLRLKEQVEPKALTIQSPLPQETK